MELGCFLESPCLWTANGMIMLVQMLNQYNLRMVSHDVVFDVQGEFD